MSDKLWRFISEKFANFLDYSAKAITIFIFIIITKKCCISWPFENNYKKLLHADTKIKMHNIKKKLRAH